MPEVTSADFGARPRSARTFASERTPVTYYVNEATFHAPRPTGFGRFMGKP